MSTYFAGVLVFGRKQGSGSLDPGHLAIREHMIVTTTNKNDGFRQNIYRNDENCKVKA